MASQRCRGRFLHRILPVLCAMLLAPGLARVEAQERAPAASLGGIPADLDSFSARTGNQGNAEAASRCLAALKQIAPAERCTDQEAQTFVALCEDLWKLGQLETALNLLHKRWELLRQAHGPVDGRTIVTADSLLGLLIALPEEGRKSPWITFAEQTLRDWNAAAASPNAELLLNRMQTLVGYYCTVARDYDKARQGIEICRKLANRRMPAHPVLEAIDDALISEFGAYVEETFGHLEEAEKLYQAALGKVQLLQAPTPTLATTVALTHTRMLLGFGQFLAKQGRHSEALAQVERANQRLNEFDGPPEVVHRALSLLGEVRFGANDWPGSVAAHETALALATRTWGAESERAVHSHAAMALPLSGIGRRPEALQHISEAIRIVKAGVPPNHELAAQLLDTRAVLFVTESRLAEAERDHRGALDELALAGALESPTGIVLRGNLGFSLAQQGRWREALPVLEEVVGSKMFSSLSPSDSQGMWLPLAECYAASGQREKALQCARRSVEAQALALRGFLGFASEQDKLRSPTVVPYSLLARLGAAEDLARAVLQFKGAVLDAQLEDQAAEEELDLLRRQFLNPSSARVLDPTVRIVRERRIAELSQQRSGTARRAPGVKLEDVRHALRPGEVLIEFVQYIETDKLDFFNQDWESLGHYGAVVISAQSAPAWIALGDNATVAREMHRYKRGVRGKQDPAPFEENLVRLHSMLWAPLEAAFPKGTRSVIVSPDGELNMLSFAGLLDKAGPNGQFVAEKYALRYVASGRDLLAATAGARSNEIVLVGNPDFHHLAESITGDNYAAYGEPDSDVAARKSGPAVDVTVLHLADIFFGPLKGTLKECEELERLAVRSGWTVKKLLDASAAETTVAGLVSPRILHLATHGFFLAENVKRLPVGEDLSNMLSSPMRRSGLALAGAQRTIEKWRRNELPASSGDGILTAEEAASLKLQGTWMVTLSACDTGIGESHFGEGVLGLRRGFIKSGAQNLLITLWPVADGTTATMMSDFYSRAFKSGMAPQSLAEMQSEWLVKLRKEKGTAAAVELAAPFIMTSMGRQ